MGTRRLIALGTVLVLLAGGTGLFVALGHLVSRSDPVRAVDVVVVPAGDHDHRLPLALDLVEDGVAEEVWITVRASGPVIDEEEAALAYAESRGLADRVEVIGSSRSTRVDAIRTGERLIDEPAGMTLAVVTSPWTLTRTDLTFDRVVGKGAEVAVWPDTHPYDAARWWQRDASVTATEALHLLETLVLFGARPVAEGEPVPFSLPVRAALGGFVVALVAGALCRKLAPRVGLIARPRMFRLHDRPVPLLGGAAILAGLAGGVLAGGGFTLGMAGMVAAGGVVALALVGLVDDIAGLGARSRLAWAAAAGGAVWLLGLRASVFDAGAAGELGNALVTILWFVGITHAMNVLDNLDGAAAGVGAAAAVTIGAVAISSGQWVVAVGAAALAGACLGYLVHNVHPARLFMGDLGALGMGFALAALAMAMQPAQTPPLSLAVAALALGVPIFDVALVTVARVRSGRPVSEGGTDHTAHRLLARGWPVWKAAGLLWVAQLTLGAVAFAIANGPRTAGWILASVVAAAGVVALVVFLRMPAWRRPVEDEPEVVVEAVDPIRRLLERAEHERLQISEPDVARHLEETFGPTERRLRDDD